MNACSPVEWDLPKNTLVDIFQKIPAVSLARCSCVAKSWREVTNTESGLRRKLGLQRAWLQDPIQPTIHKGHGAFCIVCCARMENLIAFGSHFSFKVLDFDAGKLVFDCDEIGSVHSVAFIDRMLVTAAFDGGLSGWDVSTWKKVFCVSIFNDRIFSIADLGDSMGFGSGGGDIQIWRKGVWELERSLQGHISAVCGLVSEKSNLLISGSYDETIRIWRLDENACIRVICGQKQGVSSLSLVCDGLIFCGARDGNIRSWDLESGEYVQTFRGHALSAILTRSVASVVTKGGRVFSGGADGTVKIWDATKGECVRSFDCSGEERGMWQMMYVLGVDDEKLTAVSGTGEIWEWDFSKGL